MHVSQVIELRELVRRRVQVLRSLVQGLRHVAQLLEHAAHDHSTVREVTTFRDAARVRKQGVPLAHAELVLRLQLSQLYLHPLDLRRKAVIQSVEGKDADSGRVCRLPDGTRDDVLQLLRRERPLRSFHREPTELNTGGLEPRRRMRHHRHDARVPCARARMIVERRY